MSSLWIVHRDPRQRAALARLAAADDAVLGAPSDPRFDAAAPPRAVVLGVTGDCEAELEFARRALRRLRESGWVLVVERRELDEVRRLFDALSARFVAYPPEPGVLRGLLQEAATRGAGSPLPLSQRAGREALAARFSRWFADLELPELLRALDPQLSEVPVLIQGEPGTGRGTLARYLHTFGGTSDGLLVHLACDERTRAEALLAELAAQAQGPRAERACTLWLEAPELLPAAVQSRLEGWVEYGPPPGAVRSARLRWVATVDEREVEGGRLEPGLRRALAGLSLRIPPLRERLDFLPNLANNTASAWCAARGAPGRRFGEDALAVLEEYPWPGNLRELDAVVAHSLASGTSNPIRPEDLRLDGEPLAPLEAGLVGALVEEPAEAGRGESSSELALLREFDQAASAPAPEDQEGEEARLPEALLLEDEENEEEPLRLEPEPEPDEPTAAAPAAPAAPPVSDATLRRLADAVSHEVRNPLTAIRTFAELLPERYGDREFRTRFARHVTDGVQRVDRVVEGLSHFAGLGPPDRKPVDVGALLEEALDARRGKIRERHLLVLKELDPEHPVALCDAEQMRFAFDAMLDRALEMLPERGDLYLASRRHPSSLRGGPSVRVLLRLKTPGRPAAAPAEGLSPAENSLGFAIAEAVARAQGGTIAIDAGDPVETVILMDLPAPGPGAAASAHP